MHALLFTADTRAFAESDQRIRDLIGMHGHVPGDIVEDIGLRQVVQRVGGRESMPARKRSLA